MMCRRAVAPRALSLVAMLLALSMLIPWSDARALRLELRVFRNQRVLMLFDCGSVDDNDTRKRECAQAETQVTCGVDSMRVDGVLSQQRFDEVWLLSGGGCKPEGIALGRALRAHRIPVRVPSLARIRLSTGESTFDVGGECISACSLAFMGGMLRYVDDGALLEIHSSSANLRAANSQLVSAIESRGLKPVVSDLTIEACSDILRTMRFFQNTLLIPTRTQVREDESFIASEARSCSPGPWYSDSAEAHDAAQIAIEGKVSMQDLLMRLERDASKAAIRFWQSRIDRFGPRAESALKMVAARYDVAILSTNPLSTESLIAMGYVTREVLATPAGAPRQ